MFAESEVRQVDVPGARLQVRTVGAGDPVLLLHGYPQTHAMWAAVVGHLGGGRRLVMPDLRGYGASLALDGDFTFRAMAADVVALADELGLERFHVIGHDRGARVAHRLALDAPDRVRSVALLDILPTLDVWRQMDDRELALKYFHWTFLAQPGGLPQRLIGADPQGYLRSTLAGLGATAEMFDPAALGEYLSAADRESVVDAWCRDYAAAATTDLEHDEADLGRTLDIPALALWGDRGMVARFDPLATWRRWFPAVTGQGVAAGHFLVEERPEVVGPLLDRHLAGA
ncbi:alpha/beta hydrolase [Ornithinimicrobium faecis]|uniref:Alpha/beta hydrolase n=1 Tax=Ornithinimicrobium faecis TaxID=2934158 RepID=A0ABY4YQZ7_9MICO|nr:alpha/beta hydrolase [Ornithinimicrobium sp. HY1793]USQ79179.1 alpha/beta hydrolase [Ornithinimicrobium sp. HY1793]